jgi:hypothetical protein
MKAKLVLGVLLTALSVGAFAQAERTQTRKEVEAFFAKFDSYINSGNLNGLFTMFDPGYYSVDTQGKRTYFPQWKAMVKSMTSSTKDVKSKITVKNVQLQDKEAVAWIQQQIWYKVNSGGRWMAKTETTRWAEQLKMTPSGWKSSSSQQLITNEPWSFKTNGL